MRLVFDPRVGLKRFINEVINFHNWHLFCVLQHVGTYNKEDEFKH